MTATLLIAIIMSAVAGWQAVDLVRLRRRMTALESRFTRALFQDGKLPQHPYRASEAPSELPSSSSASGVLGPQRHCPRCGSAAVLVKARHEDELYDELCPSVPHVHAACGHCSVTWAERVPEAYTEQDFAP